MAPKADKGQKGNAQTPFSILRPLSVSSNRGCQGNAKGYRATRFDLPFLLQWSSKGSKPNQAKLGEENKMYYSQEVRGQLGFDAFMPVARVMMPQSPTTNGSQHVNDISCMHVQLKRWVERGKEEEAAREAGPPPPPIVSGESFSSAAPLSK